MIRTCGFVGKSMSLVFDFEVSKVHAKPNDTQVSRVQLV